MPSVDKSFTVSEVAALFGVTRQAVDLWIRRGHMKVLKRKWRTRRVSPAEVERVRKERG